MILAEFKVNPDASGRLGQWLSGQWFRLGEVVGHAYADALGRYETRGTWKVLVELYAPDDVRVPAGVAADDHRDGVGVATVVRKVEVLDTPLALSDDLGARLYLLELIHGATLAVADEVGWDKAPFVPAYERVAADPRFRRCRAWKPSRARTARARVCYEELPEQVVGYLEIEDGSGRVTGFGPVNTSYAYLRGAWAETRDLVWERDTVVLRLKDGTELMRVTGAGGDTPQSVISHHPGWLGYAAKVGDLGDRRELAAWAVACAERVLPIFEAAHPQDRRPRAALVGIQRLVRGEARVEVADDLAALANAAAADAKDPAGIASARACAYAAGILAAPSAAKSVSAYTLKAIEFTIAKSGADLDAERSWQLEHLPERFRASVFHGS